MKGPISYQATQRTNAGPISFQITQITQTAPISYQATKTGPILYQTAKGVREEIPA